MKLKLYLDYDDDTGVCGLRCGEEFNSFWDGRGIFHDVFEHWFETNHKYWYYPYAYNRAGEIAAMGAFLYFTTEMYIPNRHTNIFHTPLDSALDTNLYPVKEYVKYDQEQYNELSLKHCIPKQKPVDNADVENLIITFVEEIQKLETGFEVQAIKSKYNFRNIADLTRWGYRQAKKLTPDIRENAVTLEHFIKDWEAFCQRVDPLDLIDKGVRSFTFNVTKNKYGIIKWECLVESSYIEFDDLTIDENNINHITEEDIIFNMYHYEY